MRFITRFGWPLSTFVSDILASDVIGFATDHYGLRVMKTTFDSGNLNANLAPVSFFFYQYRDLVSTWYRPSTLLPEAFILVLYTFKTTKKTSADIISFIPPLVFFPKSAEGRGDKSDDIRRYQEPFFLINRSVETYFRSPL